MQLRWLSLWALSLLLLSRGGLFRLELLGFRFELLVMLQVLGVFVEPVGEVLDRVPRPSVRHLDKQDLIAFFNTGSSFLGSGPEGDDVL